MIVGTTWADKISKYLKNIFTKDYRKMGKIKPIKFRKPKPMSRAQKAYWRKYDRLQHAVNEAEFALCKYLETPCPK